MEIMEVNEKLHDAQDKDTILEIGRLNNQIMENLIRYTFCIVLQLWIM